jgi:hypothetical protein
MQSLNGAIAWLNTGTRAMLLLPDQHSADSVLKNLMLSLPKRDRRYEQFMIPLAFSDSTATKLTSHIPLQQSIAKNLHQKCMGGTKHTPSTATTQTGRDPSHILMNAAHLDILKHNS